MTQRRAYEYLLNRRACYKKLRMRDAGVQMMFFKGLSNRIDHFPVNLPGRLG
jgi:hypothetical protein